MIFDSIKNKNLYKNYPLIYQALNFLETLEPETAPKSKVILIPNKLFCNTVELISKPENEFIYEAHNKYIDLHYLISGTEGIATANRDSLKVQTAYKEKADIEFLEGAEDGRYYLKPKQFMICFPSDAHRVGIMLDKPENIKKIVFKIKAVD